MYLPPPTVVLADGMSDADMQQVARAYGHECGFVFAAPVRSDFEDAATGIAAAALASGLLQNQRVSADERPVHIRQGRAVGRPSQICLRFRRGAAGQVKGCWQGGPVEFAEAHS